MVRYRAPNPNHQKANNGTSKKFKRYLAASAAIGSTAFGGVEHWRQGKAITLAQKKKAAAKETSFVVHSKGHAISRQRMTQLINEPLKRLAKSLEINPEKVEIRIESNGTKEIFRLKMPDGLPEEKATELRVYLDGAIDALMERQARVEKNKLLNSNIEIVSSKHQIPPYSIPKTATTAMAGASYGVAAALLATLGVNSYRRIRTDVREALKRRKARETPMDVLPAKPNSLPTRTIQRSGAQIIPSAPIKRSEAITTNSTMHVFDSRQIERTLKKMLQKNPKKEQIMDVFWGNAGQRIARRIQNPNSSVELSNLLAQLREISARREAEKVTQRETNTTKSTENRIIPNIIFELGAEKQLSKMQENEASRIRSAISRFVQGGAGNIKSLQKSRRGDAHVLELKEHHWRIFFIQTEGGIRVKAVVSKKEVDTKKRMGHYY